MGFSRDTVAAQRTKPGQSAAPRGAGLLRMCNRLLTPLGRWLRDSREARREGGHRTHGAARGVDGTGATAPGAGDHGRHSGEPGGINGGPGENAARPAGHGDAANEVSAVQANGPGHGAAVAAFEADLARLGDREPRARALLTALAWARGPGLPWDEIWVPVARALDGGPGVRAVSGRDVRRLLRTLGPYLTVCTGPGGRPVYRLRDEPVAVHLRAWPAGEWAEEQITAALLRTVPATARGRDWLHAHPYLRTYLAHHAAAAGPAAFADLIGDSDFLAVADPGTVLPVMSVEYPQAREAVLAYRRAGPRLGPDPHANAAYLQEAARALAVPAPAPPATDSPDPQAPHGAAPSGAEPSSAEPSSAEPSSAEPSSAEPSSAGPGGAGPGSAGPGGAGPCGAGTAGTGTAGTGTADVRAAGRIRPRYRTRLASVRRDDSLLVLAGHTAMVYCVTTGTTRDGRPLLASASDDTTIRRWDPFTGTPVGDPLTGHGDAERASEPAPVGQTVKPSETYWTHGGEVESVAFGTTYGGQLLLASAGCDRTVRLWDPVTGEPVGRPLTGHTGRVWAVAFGTAPDGQLLLASVSDDLTVRVWDPLTGALACAPLTGHTDQVCAADFGTTPDGRFLLVSASSDATVRLWDPLAGVPAGPPLTGHEGPVYAAKFATAPDGTLLLATGGEDGTVRLWNAARGAPLGEPLTGHTDRVDGLAFSNGPPNTWLLASCGRDQAIRLWDPLALTTSQPACATARARSAAVGEPLTGHTGWVVSVAFFTAPDGRPLLASSSTDTTIRVWDALAAASPRQPADGHTRWVTSAAFGAGPGGQQLLAAGTGDAAVRVWDTRTGAPAHGPLTGHARDVTSVAIGAAPGGRALLAAGSGDSTVRVWDLLTGAPASDALAGHRRMVRTVAFGAAPGGQLLLASGSADETVRVWDPLAGTPLLAPFTGHTGWVDSVAFGTTHDGALLLASGGEDGTVRVWDPFTGTTVSEWATGPAHRLHALALASLPGGGLLLATGGEDGTVRLWHPVTGTPAGKPLTGHAGWVASLSFVTAGHRLLLASGSGDRTVRIWDPLRGACLLVLRRASAVRSVTATGLTLAISGDDGLTVIDLDDPSGSRGHGLRPALARLRHQA